MNYDLPVRQPVRQQPVRTCRLKNLSYKENTTYKLKPVMKLPTRQQPIRQQPIRECRLKHPYDRLKHPYVFKLKLKLKLNKPINKPVTKITQQLLSFNNIYYIIHNIYYIILYTLYSILYILYIILYITLINSIYNNSSIKMLIS
jgi:hypothetical protein